MPLTWGLTRHRSRRLPLVDVTFKTALCADRYWSARLGFCSDAFPNQAPAAKTPAARQLALDFKCYENEVLSKRS